MGHRLKLSNGRQLVDDVIHIANQIPAAGISGNFCAEEVAQLRRLTNPKISWNVLYMKAFALVASRHPALCQTYVKFPWPHLYQHESVVCMLTLSREHEGEERLFFARFNEPEKHSLAELQERYDYLRRAPIHEIKQFRHQIRFAKAPRLLRRLGWWVMFDVWPRKRASHIGTIGMSVSGYHGSYGNRHLGPLTTILGVEPMPRKGNSRLVFTFDHRVMDGIPATQALHKIHQALKEEIRDELSQLVGKRLPSQSAA